MNPLLYLCLATAGTLLLTSCETTYNEDDRSHNHGSTTTTTTEETTLRSPLSPVPSSTTVETQTTRSY